MAVSRGRPCALVTGGARRVGRAICLALARAGCDVAYTFRTSDAASESLLGELRGMGREAWAWGVDLNDVAAVEAFGERAVRELPRLDVLVHNASVYEATELAEIDAEVALRHYRVNALAPLLLTRALADNLKASTLEGGGAVVALCDIHAMGRPRMRHAPYSMSKAALVELVYSLARDLAPRVRVNGVALGVAAFPESGAEADPEMQKRYLSRVPLGRAGTPEDAAEAVRWVALEAKYTTGTIVRADGGRWIG